MIPLFFSGPTTVTKAIATRGVRRLRMSTIDSGGTPVGRRWTPRFRRIPSSASCFAVSVYDEDDLVGMGRVVGDLGLCFYIQDVIVVSSYQGRGLGDAIMRRLMKFISDHATENTYVGLMSAAGKEPFYHKFGFTTRPTEALGAGMTLLWS